MRRQADEYVAHLERQGISVHYPPRDVDQTDDGIGLRINEANRAALLDSDEVHVIWDSSSKGSHFDLGMAFMLQALRQCPIVLAAPPAPTPGKGYENILRAIGTGADPSIG
jgi:hypothetical protein